MNGIDRLKAISATGQQYGAGSWGNAELEHIRACLPHLIEMIVQVEQMIDVPDPEDYRRLLREMDATHTKLWDTGRTDG